MQKAHLSNFDTPTFDQGRRGCQGPSEPVGWGAILQHTYRGSSIAKMIYKLGIGPYGY